MKAFFAAVNALLEPDTWIVTGIRFAPYASEQHPIEHVWQIGKHYVRDLFRSRCTFLDIKEAFEHIKDRVFTFADLAMYMSSSSVNQQPI